MKKKSDKMFKLSIVTINYNNYDGLVKTGRSVLDQFDSVYEWIIVDGLSNDGSKEYIDDKKVRFANKVKTIIEKDDGIYDAMNKGLQVASGEYILFLNSGDWLSSNILYKFAEIDNLEKVKFIYGDYYRVGDEVNYISSRKCSWAKNGMFTSHQSMIYRLDVIKKNKLFYNIDYKLASDYDFTLKFLLFLSDNETLKLEHPIAYFDNTGISSSQRLLGIKENYHIRVNTYGMNHLYAMILYVLHIAHYFLKKKFPSIMDRIRAKK
ncbi:glycosyltransferase [Photobacterium sp. DNB23_23_1]